MKRDSEKNSKELKTLESELKAASQQMYAARRQVKQAQMEFANITRSFGNDSDQVDASPRLASVPKDHSQRIFWMRYGEIIGQTIKTYEDPQPEGAQEQLTTAFDKLNQANKIANEFLDLIYRKEQKASSSQGQA